MRLFLCGGVAVETGGRRLPDTAFAGRQGRLVLAYLVCERHRSVPREELAALLWGEHVPASWSPSLSAVVSKLRRMLTDAGLDGPDAMFETMSVAMGDKLVRLELLPEGDVEEAIRRLADA